MKKTLRTVLTLLAVVMLVGGAVGGYFIWKHVNTYISRDAAVQIVLSAAQLDRTSVRDVSVDFDSNRYSAWYDVDIDTHGTEYEYSVDAVSGTVIYSHADAEKHD